MRKQEHFSHGLVESRFTFAGEKPVAAAHPSWKGYLKLSLVYCPILLYRATSARARINLRQLNRRTGHRIKYRKVDAESGEDVATQDIIRGYEVSNDEYIELHPSELHALAPPPSHSIEIEKFIPTIDIDELYLHNCYFVVPDDKADLQAFAVIRDAIRKEDVVAVGKVVFKSREQMIAFEARGRGMLATTLRYPYEVRTEKDYFQNIPEQEVPADMLQLASTIVQTKLGAFDPEEFHDNYEDALCQLLRKKDKAERHERSWDSDRTFRQGPSNSKNIVQQSRHQIGQTSRRTEGELRLDLRTASSWRHSPSLVSRDFSNSGSYLPPSRRGGLGPPLISEAETPSISPAIAAVDARNKGIEQLSWAAVLAGVVLSLVTQMVLSMLGLGIGAATLEPVFDSISAPIYLAGAEIWFAVANIVAALVGGYAAGRLAGSPASTGGWHGLTSWGLGTLVVFCLLFVGGIFGGAQLDITSTLGGSGVVGTTAEAVSAASLLCVVSLTLGAIAGWSGGRLGAIQTQKSDSEQPFQGVS